MNHSLRWLITIVLFGSVLTVQTSWALTGVNPTGVNVRATGITSVFLTFQGVSAAEDPVAAFWCGEITVPANTVTAFDPCVPGTRFGALAARNDLSQRSGTRGTSNLTDIMTIPASVARRAYQDAERGSGSAFFYVRQFVDRSTGQSSFVAVTCRMAGGGARVPLALIDVRYEIADGSPAQNVLQIGRGQTLPPLAARIRYNGSGRLRGRWEVVLPGESLPQVMDLVPEPSLPVEQRGLQRRYTELARFDRFLQPNGELVLPGPDPALLPTASGGLYLLLLRIESSVEKESQSNTTAGVANSGGIAGFPLPVLRYYVVGEASGDPASTAALQLLTPLGGAEVDADTEFQWLSAAPLQAVRLEFGCAAGALLQAVLPGDAQSYRVPRDLLDKARASACADLAWRAVGFDASGQPVSESEWRDLRLRDGGAGHAER